MLSYLKTQFSMPSEVDLSELQPLHSILLTMVGNLLALTNDHMTNTNKIELYLFYCFMENIRIDFGFIMYLFMNKVSTDTRQKLPYEKFMTSNFNHFNIPLIGQPSKERFIHFFNKNYFERKNLNFFDRSWHHKETMIMDRTKHSHDPLSSSTRHSKCSRTSTPIAHPSFIGPTMTPPPSFSSNQILALLHDLKNNMTLFEHGLYIVMQSEQMEEYERM